MTPSLALLAALAFISLGLPDGLLGVAWPSMRATFSRDLDAIGVLLAAVTTGYVASSFTSGGLLRRMNVGTVLAASALMTGAGLVGYAAAPAWAMVIVLGVVLGLGSGAIDSSLNAYAARHHGPRTLNWLHACYGIGAAGGPLIMTAVLARSLPWRYGYAGVGVAQLALAAGFAATRRWWQQPAALPTVAERSPATIAATLRTPGARLGIAVFVVYAGVEGSLGVWTYTLLTEGRGVATTAAGSAASAFWGSLTAGRLLAAVAGTGARPERTLGFSIAAVAVGTALIWIDTLNGLTYAGLLLAGLACGPIFPTLVAMTPARVGTAHAANAVGFQVAAAAVGLALLPGLVGVAADAFGVESIAASCLALALLLGLAYLLLDAVAPLAVTPGSLPRGGPALDDVVEAD